MSPEIRFPRRQRTLGSTLRGIGHAVLAPFVQTRTFRVQDYRVRVGAHTLFARQLAKYRAYEPANSNWMARRFAGVGAEGLFVDVGANFGWYSMLLARLCPAARVVALEPSADNFELLQANLALNGFTNVRALRLGAGAQAARLPLHKPERHNPGAHTLRATAGQPGEAAAFVDIEPLDTLLASTEGVVRLMKIDVEGFELEVLKGATATLARTDCVLLEYSPEFLADAGARPEDLLDLLQAQGFVAHRLVGDAAEGGVLEPVPRQRLLDRDPALAGGQRWQVDLVFMRG